MNTMEYFYGFFGGDKYNPAGICMTSDYVLVNTFTVLRLATAVFSLILCLLFFMLYWNPTYLMRMAVTMLKDTWLVKLIGLTFMMSGLNQIVATLIIHYSVYYLQAAMLVLMTGVFFYTAYSIVRIALDQTRQASILSAFLDEKSETADYGFGAQTEQGQFKELNQPLPIKYVKPEEE